MRSMKQQRSFFSSLLRFGVPALVVIFALGGTGAYAYESESVTPEHPLYPVRRAVEKIEAVATVRSPKASIEARERRVTHRLEEAKRLQPGTPFFSEVLAEVDRELAETTSSETPISVEEVVRQIDEKTFNHLEGIAKKDPKQALPVIERFIVNDAERIERHLPQQTTAARRQFFAERLTRRRASLEALHPMSGQAPLPFTPSTVAGEERTVVEPGVQIPSPASTTSTSASFPHVRYPPQQEQQVSQPTSFPNGEPRVVPQQPSTTLPINGNISPEQLLPTTTQAVAPQAPSTAPTEPAGYLLQSGQTVNMYQFFPHPKSVNGVPWASLPLEVRVRYYQEYLRRLQQQRQTTHIAPSTTTNTE